MSKPKFTLGMTVWFYELTMLPAKWAVISGTIESCDDVDMGGPEVLYTIRSKSNTIHQHIEQFVFSSENEARCALLEHIWKEIAEEEHKTDMLLDDLVISRSRIKNLREQAAFHESFTTHNTRSNL